MKMICRSLISVLPIVLILMIGVAVVSSAKAAGISAASKAVRDTVDLRSPTGGSRIFGFNYQPSWGCDGLTVWGNKFDAKKYREELTIGKTYFPNMNSVRMWLSWDSYRANPIQFVNKFQQAVDICGDLDLLVVPVILNRWTGNPSWGAVTDSEIASNFTLTFAPYIRDVVTPMKGDNRILAWDLCNEPLLNTVGELPWLGNIRAAVKQADPIALTCIGTVTVEQTAACAKYEDILTPHLYQPYLGNVESYCQLAKTEGKPLISTECCWGSLDDAKRAATVRADLAIMKEHGIGFIPHALYESYVADLHRPQYGYVDAPGYMAFVNMDGSLRAGHDVYNQFAETIPAPEPQSFALLAAAVLSFFGFTSRPKRQSPIPRLVAMVLAAITIAASTTVAADPVKMISAKSKADRDRISLKSPDGCSHINGFNYQPSWASSGLAAWGDNFDPKKYREELSLGKKYFPKFNAVRIWLSWRAYQANPEQCIRNFQQAVDICGDLDLLVVPVIFSRWTSKPLWEFVENPEVTADFAATFAPFVTALVTPMKGDLRILAWDLCNEPGGDPAMAQGEVAWLAKVRETIKQIDPTALVCIGTMPGTDNLVTFGHLQDILTPHLYVPLYDFPPKTIPAKIEDNRVPVSCIAESFELAKKQGKPMMSTECCWGAEDDAERVGIIRINLQALREYKIGFFPHALYTSGVADLHKSENHKDGLYMPFILEDGSLRPGHDVYNEFAQ